MGLTDFSLKSRFCCTLKLSKYVYEMEFLHHTNTTLKWILRKQAFYPLLEADGDRQRSLAGLLVRRVLVSAVVGVGRGCSSRH